MKILIPTEPDDVHAVLVKLALEKKGYICTLDYQFIKKENAVFHDSIPWIMSANAWWINPYESIKQAKSKIYQLDLASKIGFKIPETLVSNSPEKIRNFILSYKEKEVIYKPFYPYHWYENDTLKLSYTKRIELKDLPSDLLLQMTPGIFQNHIKKKYELRVTCFGNHQVAVKISSQQHPKGLTDWRGIPEEELEITPYILSNVLREKIQIFMKKLNIVFGCFDFIVSSDDEIYFLEVNQQGQFLWIEDRLPEMYMLDRFVNFILQRSVNFTWKKTAAIQIADYEVKASSLIEKNRANHIYLNAIKKFDKNVV